MKSYFLYDSKVNSEIELNIPTECNKNPTHDILISESNKPISETNINWFHSDTNDSKTWLSYGKDKDNIYLKFHDLADFSINTGSSEIVCFREKNISTKTLQHLILDQVIPRSLTLNQKLLIHGSSVSTNDKSVAFIGASGSGKSTLATFFCLNGFELVSDDILMIDKLDKKFFVKPSYPGLRLWKDAIEILFKRETVTADVTSYNPKQLLLTEKNEISYARKPVGLNCIYLIENSDRFSIRKISSSSAFREIIKSIIRLDITDEETNTYHFKCINNIISEIDVYKINYKKEPESLEKILSHVRREVD